MDLTEYIDLAAERLGGRAIAANDEYFAPKENLLKAASPVWIADKYTDVGKWMDGWETRRRRTPGHDWCIIRLGLPGIVRGVIVDTSHFKGNFPEDCEIESCVAEGEPTAKQLEEPATCWSTLLPTSPLAGDAQNRFMVSSASRVTHLRFKIYPDGGVARLRVHGEVIPDWAAIERTGERDGAEIDLAAVEHGGLVMDSSDMFFGSRNNLILPGRSTGMHDGWETRRRRGPGHDWCVVRLGAPGTVLRVEVDTAYFKGNFPESCSLEVCCVADSSSLADVAWKEILARAKLKADSLHIYEKEISKVGEATHARLHIYPDGGIARLRVFGNLTRRPK